MLYNILLNFKILIIWLCENIFVWINFLFISLNGFCDFLVIGSKNVLLNLYVDRELIWDIRGYILIIINICVCFVRLGSRKGKGFVFFLFINKFYNDVIYIVFEYFMFRY